MPRKKDRRKSPHLAETFEPFNRKKVFYDLDTIEGMFGDAVKDNPRLADGLAWLLYRVIREMNKGKKGRKRIVNTMKLAVEWLYSYTEARNASFKLFLYYLHGMMLSPYSVQDLLKEAIQKTREHHGLDEPESEEPNGQTQTSRT